MASQEERSASSRYPSAQAHSNEPSVLRHRCAHDSSAAHSSLSATTRHDVPKIGKLLSDVCVMCNVRILTDASVDAVLVPGPAVAGRPGVRRPAAQLAAQPRALGRRNCAHTAGLLRVPAGKGLANGTTIGVLFIKSQERVHLRLPHR